MEKFPVLEQRDEKGNRKENCIVESVFGSTVDSVLSKDLVDSIGVVGEDKWPWNFKLHGCKPIPNCICSVVNNTESNQYLNSDDSNFRDTNAQKTDEKDTKPMEHSIHSKHSKYSKHIQYLLDLESIWKCHATNIWCISLQEREDRVKLASVQFHMYGLCRLVTFFRPQRPTEIYCREHQILSRGIYGCWTSHWIVAILSLLNSLNNQKGLSVLKSIDYENENENENNLDTRSLVFEDDIHVHSKYMTVPHMSEILHNINYHLPKDWDLFKYGQITFSGTAVDSCQDRRWLFPTLFKARSSTTHAMLWSHKGLKKMAASKFESIKRRIGVEWDVDRWFQLEKIQMYGCYPQIIAQSNSESSNIENVESPFLNFFRMKVFPTVLKLQRNTAVVWDPIAYYIIPIILLMLLLLLFSFPVALAVSCHRNPINPINQFFGL